MKQAKGRREMFNEKIKKLRKQSQLSQEDLAEKLLISRQTITKWEGGFSFPDISNLIELSELFKVTVDYLVKGETDCAQPVNPLIKNPDFQQMVQFLYVAKQNTYAAGGKAIPTSLRLTSKDYYYTDETFTYQDSYLGNSEFIGEEIISKHNTPLWGMGYSGKVLDESFSSPFLKDALLHLPSDFPLRGPVYYNNGAYTYTCKVDGDFTWFNGKEEIYYENKKVYELYFHGGTLV